MTYADGMDWHSGTQALPLPASVSTANFRDQGDGERTSLQRQGQAAGTDLLVCISAPALWLEHN